MTVPQKAPPKEVEGRTRQVRPSTQEVRSAIPDDRKTPGGELVWLPCTRKSPGDLRTQLNRRRAAAQRSVPLSCGSCRDPLLCNCTQPPMSDATLDAWRDAALKLLFDRHIPLLPIEVRRALWRRGGPDRVLAERLHAACGGEVA